MPRPARRARQRVHPHSRGENVFVAAGGLEEQGSSPLARGKLPGPQTSCVVCRFIPTRAGKMVLVAV